MRYSDDMPKWFINAKELWKMLIHQRDINKELPSAFSVNMGINQAVGLMNSLPAADVVEVVRCKDCRHYIQPWQDCEECRCSVFNGSYDRPFPTEPDDFCSYGERRCDNEAD